jgi:hypothetical protein
MDFVCSFIARGFRMVGIGTDIGLMQSAAQLRLGQLAQS